MGVAKNEGRASRSGSGQVVSTMNADSDGNNSVVKFEDFLQLVGENGRWQIIIFLFTWIEGALIGCHHLSSVFLGASMSHWCNTSHIGALNTVNWTVDQKMKFAIPYNSKSQKYESCQMFQIPPGFQVPSDFDQALNARPDHWDKISCDQESIPMNERYEYDTSEGITSIVNSWQLVCERLPLLSTIQGSYMGGVFVGCLVFGWASDKFGRRTTMLVASVIQIVASIAAAFSVNYIMFIFLRFLVAFSVSGVFECGFVLVTEICGPKFRAPFGILTQFPFGVGAAFLPLMAYFIRDWVNLQLAISIPCLLLLTYYWFIPESPRWLMAEGRFEEALVILKQGAKANRRTLPPDSELREMMERFKTQEEEIQHHSDLPKTKKEQIYEVFKELIMLVETPEMRKRSLNIFFSWLIVAMVYYGLSFNSKNIGGNRYVASFASGFVEIPAVVVIIPLLSRLGRAKCYCGTFLGGGICCGLVAIITFATNKGEMIWLPVTIGMIGKFLISMTFAIAYLYTAELFPTIVRNVAVGTASTFARIGSMSAPYIVDLLGASHAAIPVIIFGICSVVAGLLSLMLPETLNKKMPETVAEVERSAKLKKLRDHRDDQHNVRSPADIPETMRLEES